MKRSGSPRRSARLRDESKAVAMEKPGLPGLPSSPSSTCTANEEGILQWEDLFADVKRVIFDFTDLPTRVSLTLASKELRYLAKNWRTLPTRSFAKHCCKQGYPNLLRYGYERGCNIDALTVKSALRYNQSDIFFWAFGIVKGDIDEKLWPSYLELAALQGNKEILDFLFETWGFVILSQDAKLRLLGSMATAGHFPLALEYIDRLALPDEPLDMYYNFLSYEAFCFDGGLPGLLCLFGTFSLPSNWDAQTFLSKSIEFGNEAAVLFALENGGRLTSLDLQPLQAGFFQPEFLHFINGLSPTLIHSWRDQVLMASVAFGTVETLQCLHGMDLDLSSWLYLFSLHWDGREEGFSCMKYVVKELNYPLQTTMEFLLICSSLSYPQLQWALDHIKDPGLVNYPSIVLIRRLKVIDLKVTKLCLERCKRPPPFDFLLCMYSRAKNWFEALEFIASSVDIPSQTYTAALERIGNETLDNKSNKLGENRFGYYHLLEIIRWFKEKKATVLKEYFGHIQNAYFQSEYSKILMSD